MEVIKTNEMKNMLSKVPEVTIFFWIIKVLCTTVGETASDFLNINLGFGLTSTSVIMGVVLAVVLFFQFKAKKYIPGIYWLTVVLISIFGTLVTDNMIDGMGIPLVVSTIVFSIALMITFALWYTSEKTLSIHSIFTKQREAFYWLTILFTFALGTATGDLMAESLGFGYLVTGILIAAVIAVVAAAWRFKMDPILAFWLVYIMTRSLGTSLGDYLSQPSTYGGGRIRCSCHKCNISVSDYGDSNFPCCHKERFDRQNTNKRRNCFKTIYCQMATWNRCVLTGYPGRNRIFMEPNYASK